MVKFGIVPITPALLQIPYPPLEEYWFDGNVDIWTDENDDPWTEN